MWPIMDLSLGECVFVECTACKQEFAVVYEPRTITNRKVRIAFCPSCGSESILFQSPDANEGEGA